MKILLIDNYDSFTFNLYHYLSSLKTKVDVIRNDEITENQIIGQVFGSKIIQAKKLMHGKTSLIRSKKVGILKNLPSKFEATRYHSLIIDKKTLAKDVEITAETENGIIMGIEHKKFNVHGVQFHPESIKTTIGIKILKNFINYKK